RLLRFALQAGHEHEGVVALPEHRRLRAAVEERVEAEVRDERLGGAGGAAGQPGGGGGGGAGGPSAFINADGPRGAGLGCPPAPRVGLPPAPHPNPPPWRGGGDTVEQAAQTGPLSRGGEGVRVRMVHSAIRNQIERQPPLSGTIGTVAPALMAGARGARMTRQSAFERNDSIELSCLSKGVATRRPCASWER